MHFSILSNIKQYDKFIGSQKQAQFLQSTGWQKFQESLGRKTWLVGVEEDGKLVAGSLVVKYSLPLGQSYLYSPRGPVMNDDEQVWNTMVEGIKKIAKEEGVIFYRAEPGMTQTKIADCRLQIADLKTTKPIQPKDSLLLDLSKTEDQLLSEMHHKTRYNIRLAERKGVEIKFGENNFEDFWKILEETYKRQGVKTHLSGYYEKMLKVGEEDGFKVQLVSAYYEKKIVACNLVVYYGDMVTYLHGGSLGEYRNIMAPHLLQWATIQRVKEDGYKWYDFWGIAPDDNPKHPWAGVTRFKKGFGGVVMHYPGTFDVVFDRVKYGGYSLVRKMR